MSVSLLDLPDECLQRIVRHCYRTGDENMSTTRDLRLTNKRLCRLSSSLYFTFLVFDLNQPVSHLELYLDTIAHRYAKCAKRVSIKLRTNGTMEPPSTELLAHLRTLRLCIMTLKDVIYVELDILSGWKLDQNTFQDLGFPLERLPTCLWRDPLESLDSESLRKVSILYHDNPAAERSPYGAFLEGWPAFTWQKQLLDLDLSRVILQPNPGCQFSRDNLDNLCSLFASLGFPLITNGVRRVHEIVDPLPLHLTHLRLGIVWWDATSLLACLASAPALKNIAIDNLNLDSNVPVHIKPPVLPKLNTIYLHSVATEPDGQATLWYFLEQLCSSTVSALCLEGEPFNQEDALISLFERNKLPNLRSFCSKLYSLQIVAEKNIKASDLRSQTWYEIFALTWVSKGFSELMYEHDS